MVTLDLFDPDGAGVQYPVTLVGVPVSSGALSTEHARVPGSVSND